MHWRLGSGSVFFMALAFASVCIAKHDNRFPHTRICKHLPTSIQEELTQIITYRFGILPNSSMVTTQVRGSVSPGERYAFSPGCITRADERATAAKVSLRAVVPDHVEFPGQWTSDHSPASPEANVLGAFGTLILDAKELVVPLVTASAETLAYYGGLFVKSGESFVVGSPKTLPITVMRIEPNYEQGYFALPEYGGGYYLEFHDLPHFWSHLNPDGRGAIILGKEASPGVFHLTAFQIPYGTAVYIPGGVIHSDALLIGEVMVIYSVTNNFSTVHIKDTHGQLVRIQLHP